MLFISRKLTDQGRKQLREHFGELNVETPLGALLGITANSGDGESWIVSQVIEGGAAAKAGILEKDRITKFNGRPVPNFLTLKEYISENEPGDVAKLEIERGAETVMLEVKFGEYD
nr:PDZ domain protein [uncultured bacterium]